MHRIGLILIAGLALSACSMNGSHYCQLEADSPCLKTPSFYIDKAKEACRESYPTLNLNAFESPRVSRRSDWKQLTEKDQVDVSWTRVLDRERERRRINPVPEEEITIKMSRSGRVVDHSHFISEAWVNWIPEGLVQKDQR